MLPAAILCALHAPWRAALPDCCRACLAATPPQISEIAGLKLDSDVTIVAMADGSSVPLPPGSGMVDKDGKVGGGRISWRWLC